MINCVMKVAFLQDITKINKKKFVKNIIVFKENMLNKFHIIFNKTI